MLFFVTTVLQIILEDMVEAVSDEEGYKAKLSHAVSQRWVSICKMLLRFLERWDILENFYLEMGLQLFPLKGRKAEVAANQSSSLRKV